MSNNDGVEGSGFGAKLACEGGNGKIPRDGRVTVGVVIGGAEGGKVVWGDQVSGPGGQGGELGVEKEISEAPFKLS